MQLTKTLAIAFIMKVIFVAIILFTIKITINSSFLKDSAPFIISTFTLIITFFQLRKNDKHNKLSVQPLLNFGIEPIHRPGIDGYFCISFLVENNGLGPANMSDTHWKLGGERCNNEMIAEHLGSISGLDYLYQQNKINYLTIIANFSGMYLKQESNRILIKQEFFPHESLNETEKKEIIKILNNAYQKIMHEIQYNISFSAISSSIYGDSIKYIDTAKKFKKAIEKQH